MDSLDERLAVVRSARRWLGTPYHHHAAVIGAGVDCARLLVEAFVGAGITEDFEVEQYNHDWHLHRDEERYLNKIEEYLTQLDDDERPLKERGEDFYVRPGNVIAWRVGRTYSHGAIVTLWPNIIHASFPARSVIEESILGGILAEKPMRVFTHWGC